MALLTGLVGGAAAVALTWVAERTLKAARVDAGGWQRLRASWMLHGIFVAAVVFTAFWVFAWNLGSSRPDAAGQNLSAIVLVIASACSAIYIGWIAYGRRISWKDSELRVRSLLGREMARSIPDVTSVRRRDLQSDYLVTFRNGPPLAFSAYLHGSDELAKTLAQRVPDA